MGGRGSSSGAGRLTNGGRGGIISVNKTMLVYKPNSITEVVNKNGGIDRNFYGTDGKQTKQISNHNHGNARLHPYGKNGEHAHDYVWDNDKLVERTTRNLTDEERKDNSDIL